MDKKMFYIYQSRYFDKENSSYKNAVLKIRHPIGERLMSQLVLNVLRVFADTIYAFGYTYVKSAF